MRHSRKRELVACLNRVMDAAIAANQLARDPRNPHADRQAARELTGRATAARVVLADPPLTIEESVEAALVLAVRAKTPQELTAALSALRQAGAAYLRDTLDS